MHFFLIGFGFKYMSVGGGFDGDIGRGVTVGGAVSDIEWGATKVCILSVINKNVT
jgi:hypothetical protein